MLYSIAEDKGRECISFLAGAKSFLLPESLYLQGSTYSREGILPLVELLFALSRAFYLYSRENLAKSGLSFLRIWDKLYIVQAQSFKKRKQTNVCVM